MDKFNEINKLKSYEAESLFNEMSENEKEKLVCHVMDMYNKKNQNEVSLTVLRLVYCSPYFSKHYESYRNGIADLFIDSERSVFNKSDIAYNTIFVNKKFLEDILTNSFYNKKYSSKNRFSTIKILEKENLLFSIWQSYFFHPETIKKEQVIEACDLYFKLYGGPCKFSVQSFKNKNDKQFYELYKYMTPENDTKEKIDFLENGYFDEDEHETIYKDNLFTTLTEHTKNNASYQQLKQISSYILNNTCSYSEMQSIWEDLQRKNSRKIDLLSMLKGIDLSVKMSSDVYNSLPQTIKEIIKEDMTKTECFMESIVNQFLEDKITKENTNLVNKILNILKEDIKINDNYISKLSQILASHINKAVIQKNNFKIEVVQTLVELEKDNGEIKEIKDLLGTIKNNDHSLLLATELEKKIIKKNLDRMQIQESIPKRRL